MKVLVTGVAGFIGFHLSKRLLDEGFDVVGIDNINDYYDVNLKYDRLNELGIDISKGDTDSCKYPKFKFYKCDISEYDDLNSIFQSHKFDKVCNLAAQAGVRYSFQNPHAYVKSNVVGFMNIIELSRIYEVSHFIYASSSSVYGNNDKVPFEESDRVDNPQSIYAATKKADELFASVYSSQYNILTTGLRFFTVYGPWGRPDMAPFLFMRSILNGDVIKVFNNGDLSRDFSYINDIITGVVCVIKGETDKNNPYKIYNIGNSSPVKLMDFISTMEKVAGKCANKDFVGMQQGDVYSTYADTSLIEHDFSFKPNTSLEYGLSEFYKWYAKYYFNS